MTDEQQPVQPEPAPEAAAPVSAPAPQPERVPFWGYADLFLFAGLSLPCVFAAWALVRVAINVFRLRSGAQAVESVLVMALGYAFLFGLMALIFRVQYDRPFWRSLGWTEARVPILWNVICGFGAAYFVSFIGSLIRTPPTSGPIVEIMKGLTAQIIVGIFGVTVAPLCEELVFRGFLQPLLVRSLGAVCGIGLAAALFGALHYSEYGASWRNALQIGIAGAAFGYMRHRTGSTKSAVIMHASFNSLSFISLLAQGRNPLH
ncbi:MAG TPA: type II CAAX endopeptidase family protein [Bryobacteraceae bacterium]|nr:type II CAAX endopeptidase family protein [Bryobacteraceae bacterium]